MQHRKINNMTHHQIDLDFICEICFERKLLTWTFRNDDLCVHVFCLVCIAKHVEVKVEGMVGNIMCPGLNCNHPLNPLLCKNVIANAIFDKWCDLLCEVAVSGFDRCYCPYQNCSELLLNECRDKLKKTNCPNCKRTFCFHCKIPWHAGYPCRFVREQWNDHLSMKLIKKNKWTRCPTCGHVVERVGGCRTIRCRCGVKFCHKCGGRHLAEESCNSKRLIRDDCTPLYLLGVLVMAAFFILVAAVTGLIKISR